MHKYDYEHRFKIINKAFGKFCVAHEIEDLNDAEELSGDWKEIEDKYFPLVTK